jgi:DNA-binding LacI/PurR family transcriptional regulator
MRARVLAAARELRYEPDLVARSLPADRPSAIVIAGNQLLVGALEALRAQGIDVGDDIALVSCDDVDLTRLYRPAISSLARDIYKSGEIAVALILDQLSEGNAPARPVVLSTCYMARASTANRWTRTMDSRPTEGLPVAASVRS